MAVLSTVATPVSTPDGGVSKAATKGLLILHAPPAVASVSVVVNPLQTVGVPRIEVGNELMVNTAVVIQPVPKV